MSIQFRCESCNQILKVPPGSAGKKVRCPQCEAVVVIPEESMAPTSEASSPPGSPTPPPPPPRDEAPFNPFAAPQSAIDQPQATSGGGALTHQTIQMGDVLDQAWRRFKPHLAVCALFTIIFFAIGFAIGFLAQIIQIGATATEEVVIIGVAAVFGFVVQQVSNAFLQTSSKRFGLNVIRNSAQPLQGIFTFDKVVPTIVFFLVFGLIIFAAVVVALIPFLIIGVAAGGEGGPLSVAGAVIGGLLLLAVVIGGVILGMRVFLTLYFIVDRDSGAVEAMKQSSMYMTGNSLTTFLTMLVAGIGATLVTLLTCGLGALVAFPFLEVLQAVIYEKTTGQYQNV